MSVYAQKEKILNKMSAKNSKYYISCWSLEFMQSKNKHIENNDQNDMQI
jgi:hypothetical protein